MYFCFCFFSWSPYFVSKHTQLSTLNRILVVQGTWLLNRASYFSWVLIWRNSNQFPHWEENSLGLEMEWLTPVGSFLKGVSEVIDHVQFHLLLSFDPGMRCNCTACFYTLATIGILPVCLIALDLRDSSSKPKHFLYVLFAIYIFCIVSFPLPIFLMCFFFFL